MTATVPSSRHDPRRVVAVTLFAAGLICLVHAALWDVVRYREGGFIAASEDLVTVGTGKDDLFRVALLADMVGCYLLYLPAVVYLRERFRAGNPWLHDLAAAAGLIFVAGGAAGAAIWAAAGPDLIRDHAAGGAAAADAARTFGTLADLVVNGLWQTVAAAGGLAWFGVLAVTWWWERRALALFTGLLALAGAGSVIAQLAGIEITQSGGPSSPALAVAGVWPLWVGVLLWRRQDPARRSDGLGAGGRSR